MFKANRILLPVPLAVVLLWSQLLWGQQGAAQTGTQGSTAQASAVVQDSAVSGSVVAQAGSAQTGTQDRAAKASAATQASAAASAYDTVEAITSQIMVVVQGAQDYIAGDPARYYTELQAVLDGVVDFGGFSRAVMGEHASGRRYKSLDAAGKEQLRGQVSAFTKIMRHSLVRTYGKGLIAFGGSRTEVQRPAGDDMEKGSARVVQLIHNDSGKPYRIEYVMRRNKQGQWRLRNLIVESINLGVIYRNQFQAAVRDNNGDIDAVIANWDAPEEGG